MKLKSINWNTLKDTEPPFATAQFDPNGSGVVHTSSKSFTSYLKKGVLYGGRNFIPTKKNDTTFIHKDGKAFLNAIVGSFWMSKTTSIHLDPGDEEWLDESFRKKNVISNAPEKAKKTDRWTERLFKALSARVARRWKFMSFRGLGGGEWRGVVDILAIRKNTTISKHRLLKSGDLFDIMLVQMKGGSARKPNASEIARLRAVKKRYHAKEIVLFSWKKGRVCKFETLGRGNEWKCSSAPAIFG